MGLFDRFRKASTVRPTEEILERWDGSTVDWAAHGVPADRVDLAARIAASSDFAVDPSGMEDEWEWALALYDDIRGLVGDIAIEALEAWLPTRTGITGALHEDREVMLVAGPIDRHTLAIAVVARLATTGDPHYWDEQPDGTALGPEQD